MFMKLIRGVGIVILAISAASCESKSTSVDNKSSSTVCIASHCESSVDSKNNTSLKPHTTEAPQQKQQLVKYQLECREDSNTTREYLLVIVVGEKARSLLGITTGLPVWGYPYDLKERCEQHKTNTIAGLDAGADGWSSAYKNGYPIICSSKKGQCLRDANGEVMQIVTFRKSVNAGAMAKKFTNRFSNTKSAYDDLPITSPPGEIIDFNSIFNP
jgi:hypothetical protein